MSKIDKLINIKSSIINKKRFGKVVVLVTLVVTSIMTTTISMANELPKLNQDNRLFKYLGINENNKTLTNAHVYINKYVTDNNLKLNINHILGDKHSLYILIDIEAPNNLVIPENSNFDNINITLKNQTSAGWNISDFEDTNLNDNKKNYVISYITEGKLNYNEISLDFKNFGYYSDKDDTFIPLVTGAWNISLKLDYTDISKEIKVNRFVGSKNNKYFITTVNISPISVSANIIGLNDGNFMIKEITLNNGTSYTDKEFISSSSSSSFLRSFANVEFSKIVDMNQIKSITIDGKVVNLKNLY